MNEKAQIQSAQKDITTKQRRKTFAGRNRVNEKQGAQC